jgi:site-specific recombinase XerD
MAGHANLSTTEKYVHVLHADLDAAARVLGKVVKMPPEAAE